MHLHYFLRRISVRKESARVHSTSHKHLLPSKKEQTSVNSKVPAPREVYYQGRLALFEFRPLFFQTYLLLVTIHLEMKCTHIKK